jgi:hypothetical protein
MIGSEVAMFMMLKLVVLGAVEVRDILMANKVQLSESYKASSSLTLMQSDYLLGKYLQ